MAFAAWMFDCTIVVVLKMVLVQILLKISCNRSPRVSGRFLGWGPFAPPLELELPVCMFSFSSMHKHAETNNIYTDNQEQLKFLKPCNKLSSSEIQVVQETKLLGVKDLQDKSYRILQEFPLQSLLV